MRASLKPANTPLQVAAPEKQYGVTKAISMDGPTVVNTVR